MDILSGERQSELSRVHCQRGLGRGGEAILILEVKGFAYMTAVWQFCRESD